MTFQRREGGSIALAAIGPVIEVAIAVPTRFRRVRRFASMLFPKPVTVRLLIDTGATLTLVKPEIFEQLRLPPHERSAINTPSTVAPHPVDVWEADLVLDDSHTLRNLRIFGCGLAMQAVDGLLGRDVLSHGIFTYEGMRKAWSLELHPPPHDEA